MSSRKGAKEMGQNDMLKKQKKEEKKTGSLRVLNFAKFKPVPSVCFWISEGCWTVTDEQSKLRNHEETLSHRTVLWSNLDNEEESCFSLKIIIVQMISPVPVPRHRWNITGVICYGDGLHTYTPSRVWWHSVSDDTGQTF